MPPATTTKPCNFSNSNFNSFLLNICKIIQILVTLVRLINGDGTSVLSMSATGGLFRWVKDPNQNQLWRMVTNSDGTVTFINHNIPNRVIDNEDRLIIKTKPYYDNAHQRWTRTGSKLKNVATNTYLCYVKGANPEITNCFDLNPAIGNNNWTIQNA